MSNLSKVKSVFNQIKANVNNPLISHLFIGSKNVLNLDTVSFTEYVATKHPDIKNTTVGVYLRNLKSKERKSSNTDYNHHDIA